MARKITCDICGAETSWEGHVDVRLPLGYRAVGKFDFVDEHEHLIKRKPIIDVCRVCMLKALEKALTVYNREVDGSLTKIDYP